MEPVIPPTFRSPCTPPALVQEYTLPCLLLDSSSETSVVNPSLSSELRVLSLSSWRMSVITANSSLIFWRSSRRISPCASAVLLMEDIALVIPAKSFEKLSTAAVKPSSAAGNSTFGLSPRVFTVFES